MKTHHFFHTKLRGLTYRNSVPINFVYSKISNRSGSKFRILNDSRLVFAQSIEARYQVEMKVRLILDVWR